jgi:hypothetical protein
VRENIDASVPEPVALGARAMATLPTSWALCGGWGVDAWLGRQTREHLDVDLSVFHDAQLLVLHHFPGDWLLNGHDEADEETTAPWDGRTLAHPGHIHAYGPNGLHLDIQLDRRRACTFVFSTQPEILLPMGRCILRSPWQVPTLVPEALLFFKGVGPIRPRHGGHARPGPYAEEAGTCLACRRVASGPPRPRVDTHPRRR